MRIELSKREIDALSFALAEFDTMFWNMTEDNPDYRLYELAWANLDTIHDAINK